MIKVTYKLKLLNGADCKLQELSKAIEIYVKDTPVHEKTSSNEFIYWGKHEKYEVDDLFLFGFYRNDELVGFAELVFFDAEKILILDYMTISKEQRSNNVFFEFYSQIILYMYANSFCFDYILSEIPFVEPGCQPSPDERLWITLLKLQNFQEIKAPYFQPSLSAKNPESEAPGLLMVYQRHQTTVIKKETLALFVDTMYFKHYMRWYTPRFDNETQRHHYYEKLLSYRKSIMSGIGHQDILLLGAAESLPDQHINKKDLNDIKLVSFVLPSLIAILTCIVVLLLLSKVFQVDINQYLVVASSVLVGYFALLSVSSANARSIFREILSKLPFATKNQ